MLDAALSSLWGWIRQSLDCLYPAACFLLYRKRPICPVEVSIEMSFVLLLGIALVMNDDVPTSCLGRFPKVPGWAGTCAGLRLRLLTHTPEAPPTFVSSPQLQTCASFGVATRPVYQICHEGRAAVGTARTAATISSCCRQGCAWASSTRSCRCMSSARPQLCRAVSAQDRSLRFQCGAGRCALRSADH